MYRKLIVLNVMLTSLGCVCMASEKYEYDVISSSQQTPSLKEINWEEKDVLEYCLSSDRPPIPRITTLDLRTANLESNKEIWQKLAEHQLNYLRRINLAGEWEQRKRGADAFLKKLSKNQTLSRLMSIDASCSDVSLETLKDFRSITLSQGEMFVRDIPSASGRYNCDLIPLYVDLNGVDSIDEDDRIRLSQPRKYANPIRYSSTPEESNDLAFFSLIIK